MMITIVFMPIISLGHFVVPKFLGNPVTNFRPRPAQPGLFVFHGELAFPTGICPFKAMLLHGSPDGSVTDLLFNCGFAGNPPRVEHTDLFPQLVDCLFYVLSVQGTQFGGTADAAPNSPVFNQITTIQWQLCMFEDSRSGKVRKLGE